MKLFAVTTDSGEVAFVNPSEVRVIVERTFPGKCKRTQLVYGPDEAAHSLYSKEEVREMAGRLQRLVQD